MYTKTAIFITDYYLFGLGVHRTNYIIQIQTSLIQQLSISFWIYDDKSIVYFIGGYDKLIYFYNMLNDSIIKSNNTYTRKEAFWICWKQIEFKEKYSPARLS